MNTDLAQFAAAAQPCPLYPDKDRYATAEAAEKAAAPRAILFGYRRQRSYLCGACDWFHITTKPPRVVAVPTGPDGRPLDHDALVAWFNARPRDVQQYLVVKDAERLLAPELAAALRDPRCVPTWLHVLKRLRAAASAATTGPTGARRTARARLTLLTALHSEARQLLPAPPTTPSKPSPITVRRYAADALARRQAAEARDSAVDLLIGRHPAEFAGLLDHTRLERGLPPEDENSTAAA
ncbi:hypothetical protein [Kitasatospora sp. NPDC058478]|uniref:hypothetical protein n=1 Tax=unclassified Kitasatospora TaxID=2633591 RepID=UPI0036645F35